MVEIDGLEEWPKLVIHLDNTFFKVNSARHIGLDDNLILDLGPNLELVHVARSGSVVVEDSEDINVVPVRVFGKFGNLSLATIWQQTHIKTEKVEQSIVNGVSGDCCQLLDWRLKDYDRLPRV